MSGLIAVVFSLLCYRSILGAIFILPFALLLEIGKWKELDKKALGWLFINAFVGMESLRLKSKEGSAKVVGALLCFGGALLISLYNRKELHLFTPVIKGITKSSNGVAGGQHHVRGTLLLLGDCICYAFWYPIQVCKIMIRILKVYPWKHWSSMLTCVLGGLQTCVIGIFLRRDKLSWQVGWNIQLFTIVYSAALGTAANYWLNLYAVEKRGPIFPPMFNTLSIVFTMVLGALLLGETITVVSLLGSALVFSGLYMYLYGKARELRAKMTSGPSNEKLQAQSTHDSKFEVPNFVP
ncbi:WAT1-related protein At5g64700-like [Triticum dicoccoides]|uniref:WAT1-related protein At5g64700-like n=1 Tax=Triticum dicoccoides TaxID=85692 RepID=UPI00188E87EA|nr:WAT1-related protein At5g64700-like [Triticum dicoccoides]